MGFGILLIGYLFLLNPGVYDGFTNFIGFAIMLYGMLLLRVYNKGLRLGFYALIPLTLLAGFDFVLTGAEFMSLYMVSDDMNTAIAIGTKLLTMIFSVALFSGIRDLGIETGLPVLRGRATRGRILSVLYFLLAAALEVATYTESATAFAVHATIPIVIFGFCVIGLNAQTIHNAFRWLCLPGEDGEDEKNERTGETSSPK